ncbi:MAG: alpha/beta fold hydrolase [Planctomycetota bacterium]|nr:MAG: alpha/beta fold hydrolase [Planctomycetota bacterium]
MAVGRVGSLVAALWMIALGASSTGALAQTGVAGRWDGSVDQPTGALAVTIRLSETDGGGLAGSAHIPLRGVLDAPLERLELDGRSVAFEVSPAGVRFELTLSEDGSELAGEMIQAGQRFTARLLRGVDRPDAEPTLFPPVPRQRQKWRAIVEFPNLNLDLAFTFTPRGESGWDGAMDVPLQALTGLAVDQIELGDEVRFVVPNPAGGDRPPLIFNLRRTAPDAARGEMRQAGSSFGVRMWRLDDPDEEVTVSRPQTPAPPFPYRTREVELVSPADGVTLTGEFVIPPGQGPFPGVVFITGSGPQDRDQTIAEHKPFLVLADRLARMGVASLRLDDRGVGGSGGSTFDATAVTLIQDINAAVEWLASQPEVADGEVGLLGHSEGAMLAPIAATFSDRPIAFLVLLAPPALPGDELLILQREALRRAQGVTGPRLARERELHERLVGLAKRGAPAEEIAQALHDLAAAERAGRDDQQAYADRVVEAQASALASPWFVDFLNRDPRPALRAATMPVLALFGERDLQVPPDPNAEKLREALESAGNQRADVRVLPVLNHLLQPCVTGLPDEYYRIMTTMSEDAIAAIEDFVGEVTSARAPDRPEPAP